MSGFKDDRLIVNDQRAVDALKHLYKCINTTKTIPIAPRYLVVIRQRMFRFLTNALVYNVNYKDLGHTNVVHYTNFTMYPFLKTNTTGLYPFFLRLFDNSLDLNGGYVEYCKSRVVESTEVSNPFVSRRDFDLALVYFILTDALALPKVSCRSYLFRGGYNTLKDIYKAVGCAHALTNKLHERPVWRPITKTATTTEAVWKLHVTCQQLSVKSIAIGLKYISAPVGMWFPDKVYGIVTAVNNVPDNLYTLEEVSVESLLDSTRQNGIYIVNDIAFGLVVNIKECSPEVYTWDSLGICRYNSVMDFLYSNNAFSVKKIK
ncbi:hypothetical protein RRG08_018556 [Elysia crispata]|uniref:Uncharacterized protein n=2 Tax=Elysia crispata TaxID=231223 RepID=A0AAE1BBS0_9GAST|nr:hypothetical protein RRG08_018556 [Elysia crispata]